MLAGQLKKLGFSDGEAAIYLAALELGEATASRIAQKAGIERSTAYGFIDNLKKRGLITHSKRGKRSVFIAESPKKLHSELEEKERFLDTLLPELLSIANVLEKKPRVRFFDSRDGIYEIYRETLQFERMPMHMWMSSPWFDDETFWRDFYMPTRIEKKVALWAILPRNDETIPFAKEDQTSLRQTRMTAGNDFSSDIMLYGGQNIAIISFSEMTAIVLESKHLYDTLRFIFQAHWDSLNDSSSSL